MSVPSLTVPSYCIVTSCIDFDIRLCIYPASEVFTPVLTNPSLPPWQWKKYSIGLSPCEYELLINPCPCNKLSYGLHHAKALLPGNTLAGLFPLIHY